jgi:Recombinase
MATGRDRMREFRWRRQKQGIGQKTVWLDQDSLDCLYGLCVRSGETSSQVVQRALRLLDAQETASPPPPPRPSTPPVTSDTTVTSDVTSDTRPALDPAPTMRTPQDRKAAMVARLQQMKTTGMRLQAIATQLNAEGVPTLSGRGRWLAGTISNLLAEGEGAARP